MLETCLSLAVIVLVIVGFVGARNEKRREFEKRIKEQTLPSGKLLPEEDVLSELTPGSLEALLRMSNEDFEAYLLNEESLEGLQVPSEEPTGIGRIRLKTDLDWLVNYAGHRLPEKNEKGNPWMTLFLAGSRVKNKYHWCV
ncbi:MAG: hypothetical protein IJ870_06600 [Alphaproteobacteria bacterium]|nr:hypothetical protein [Alphaproteobacteria bacterium]